VSFLPCDRDPEALGVTRRAENAFRWNLPALREHVVACRTCRGVFRIFSIMTGSQGGAAGRGAAKRRGDSAYYRSLPKRKSATGSNEIARRCEDK
jgi:hypothetical protein